MIRKLTIEVHSNGCVLMREEEPLINPRFNTYVYKREELDEMCKLIASLTFIPEQHYVECKPDEPITDYPPQTYSTANDQT